MSNAVRTYAAQSEEDSAKLSLNAVIVLVEHYNQKAGCEPISIDDALDCADDPKHEPRKAVYEFGLERDHYILQES